METPVYIYIYIHIMSNDGLVVSFNYIGYISYIFGMMTRMVNLDGLKSPDNFFLVAHPTNPK